MRDRLCALWIRSELHRFTSERARANRKQGNPGPEFSVGKLAQAELNQDIHDAAIDLLGPAAMLYEPGFARRRPEGRATRDRQLRLKHGFLRSQANTIEGGTSDVMRNILGERVLGLPGDVRTDKDAPWKDIPRNS
jgi:alkylation response protein AidB-like acyl-CoA dehydrogenase